MFCASLADIFEDRPELQAPRQRLFGLIEECEGLDWLLLTKRPENMLTMTASRWARWPDNVWAGTTAENREELKNRAVWLQDVPAKIRFLSCEPLLESLPELENYLDWISWVIVGGESGKGARPFHMNWASNIIHDCAYANVPCFVKQMGENVRDWNARGEREDIADFDKAALGDTYSKRIFFTGKGADPEEWPPSLRVRQFPEARP